MAPTGGGDILIPPWCVLALLATQLDRPFDIMELCLGGRAIAPVEI